MTVKELKEKLKSMPDNLTVYLADHDHAEYETNSRAHSVDIVDQKNASEKWHNDPFNSCFKIKEKYVVIHA